MCSVKAPYFDVWFVSKRRERLIGENGLCVYVCVRSATDQITRQGLTDIDGMLAVGLVR